MPENPQDTPKENTVWQKSVTPDDIQDAFGEEASAAGFTYPHCDPRVLHSPGVCTICDKYAALAQKLRKKSGVPFTDELAPGDPLLPGSERNRRSAEMWGGNRPPMGYTVHRNGLDPGEPPKSSNIAQYKGILGRIRARWNRFRAWLRN